jgi:hypothetical protein
MIMRTLNALSKFLKYMVSRIDATISDVCLEWAMFPRVWTSAVPGLRDGYWLPRSAGWQSTYQRAAHLRARYLYR